MHLQCNFSCHSKYEWTWSKKALYHKTSLSMWGNRANIQSSDICCIYVISYYCIILQGKFSKSFFLVVPQTTRPYSLVARTANLILREKIVYHVARMTSKAKPLAVTLMWSLLGRILNMSKQKMGSWGRCCLIAFARFGNPRLSDAKTVAAR